MTGVIPDTVDHTALGQIPRRDRTRLKEPILVVLGESWANNFLVHSGFLGLAALDSVQKGISLSLFLFTLKKEELSIWVEFLNSRFKLILSIFELLTNKGKYWSGTVMLENIFIHFYIVTSDFFVEGHDNTIESINV